MRVLVAGFWMVVACSDNGGGDPCIGDRSDARALVGCNGPLLGPDEPVNEFGGLCTPDPAQPPAELPLPGSCIASTDRCAAVPGQSEGICLRRCDPAATFISTGGCPAGSRCFTIDASRGNAFCFPDCVENSDCASGVCDLEGGCTPPGS